MNDTASFREQHTLALLCPHEFSQRMLRRWTTPCPEGLGQHSSPDLVTLWRIMGENFQLATVEAAYWCSITMAHPAATDRHG